MSGNEGIFLTRIQLASLLAFYKTQTLKPFKEDITEARIFLKKELKTFKQVVCEYPIEAKKEVEKNDIL